MNTPLFYIALFAHLISLVVAFGSVIVMDTIGLLWIIKKAEFSFFVKATKVIGKLVWLGWAGLVVSGTILITLKGYIDNLTWIKLFFVAMVAVNGYFLHRLGKAIEVWGDNPLSPKMKFRMAITGMVSQIGWWGAIAIGFVHRHIEHHIFWPKSPLPFILIFIIVLGIVISSGEFLFRTKPENVSK